MAGLKLVAPAAILALTMAAAAQAQTGGSVEARLSRVERVLESRGMLDLLRRVDSLEREVQQLRGDIEHMSHDADSLQGRQKDMYLDLDRRLRALEQGGATASGAGTSLPPEQTAPTAPSQPPVSGSSYWRPEPGAGTSSGGRTDQEQADYDRAFALLKDSRYDPAIQSFRRFLQDHPSSDYGANAQYWLGEAYYVTGAYREAITEFSRVLSGYPGSPKEPDALLKIGFSDYSLGKWSDARRAFQEVVNRFPKTTAARLAQNRLQRMSLEGH